MNAKQAVAQRIVVLCQEKNIAINELGNMAGINPSTIYSILGNKSNNPGVSTIKKICDALEMDLQEFFSADIFKQLEQEIK